MLAVALLALRLWWGRVAERRLHAALDQLASRGEPVRAEDLDHSRLDDAANAAAYLKQAAASVNATTYSPANTAMDFPAAYTPRSPKWHDVAKAAMAVNGPAFVTARRARAFDRADWGQPAALLFNPGPLNAMRALANTLGDGALYAHEAGDDVAALETIRDVRHVAAAVGQHPLLVNNLVSVGIDALAMARLHEIATGLRIDPHDAPAPAPPQRDAAPAGPFASTQPTVPPRGPSPAHVRALIAELLDDRAPVAAARGAWAGERLSALEAQRGDARNSWLVRPAFDLDAVRVVKIFDAMEEASAQPTWPEAQALLNRTLGPPPPPAPRSPAGQVLTIDWSRVVSSILFSGVGSGRAIEQHFRSTTERRLVAVKLAAQLYRADHGQWPPDGGDRPVVYSAGPNGVFDTRGPQSVPNVPIYGWARGADEWRDLARWAPPTPATAPSTQAVDDQPDKPDDPR